LSSPYALANASLVTVIEEEKSDTVDVSVGVDRLAPEIS